MTIREAYNILHAQFKGNLLIDYTNRKLPYPISAYYYALDNSNNEDDMFDMFAVEMKNWKPIYDGVLLTVGDWLTIVNVVHAISEKHRRYNIKDI